MSVSSKQVEELSLGYCRCGRLRGANECKELCNRDEPRKVKHTNNIGSRGRSGA